METSAHVIQLSDPEYPARLAALTRPPAALFVRGRLPRPLGAAVAIVGSRLADLYGVEVAGHFARHLAAAGVVVVSGLARGIDAAAHEAAMAMPRGRTVAVLGCGLGMTSPRGQARLAAAIAARGALVSEFPCDDPPRPWRFAVRNRTIAALSAVTLVVQATPRSGSLDTARRARDLGRLVFAVPGPVFSPLSWGPHQLLRGGALLAGHPEDILENLPAASAAAAASTPAADPSDPSDPSDTTDTTDTTDPFATAPGAATVAVRAALVAFAGLRPRIARRGRAPEQVAALAGIEIGAALAALLELEIAGEVEILDGPAYRLAKRPPPPRTPPGPPAILASAGEPVVLSAPPNRPARHTRPAHSK